MAEKGGRFSSLEKISCSTVECIASKRPRNTDPDFEPKRQCVGILAPYSLEGSTSPFSNSSVVNASSELMLVSPEESSAQMTFRFEETIAEVQADTCSTIRQERHVSTRNHRMRNRPLEPAIGFLSEHDASNYLMRSLVTTSYPLFTFQLLRGVNPFCPAILHDAVWAAELRAQLGLRNVAAVAANHRAVVAPAAGLARLPLSSWPWRPSAVL